jgi:hypothetical protein
MNRGVCSIQENEPRHLLAALGARQGRGGTSKKKHAAEHRGRNQARVAKDGGQVREKDEAGDGNV